MIRTLFLLVVGCGLLVAGDEDEKCEEMQKGFKKCLSQGYQPKELKGCKVGDGKPTNKREKRCKQLEDFVTSECESFACQECITLTWAEASLTIDKYSEVKVEWKTGRPDAYGDIDRSVYPRTGKVNFPDDKEYSFWYYPDESVIYWDQDRGSNTWGGGVRSKCGEEPDLCGYIQHYGGSCIHPLGGTGKAGAEIIIHPGCNDERLYFCLTREGQLMHKKSGLCIQPKSRSNSPADNEVLILHDCDSDSTKFLVTEGGSIQHDVSMGKCWHPNGGSATPASGTKVILHSGCDQDRLKFTINYVD